MKCMLHVPLLIPHISAGPCWNLRALQVSGASFANALSVLDTAHLGALEAQLGASNFAFLGSQYPVSSMALTERARVGSSLAVVDVLSLGASLSVRRFLIMPLYLLCLYAHRSHLTSHSCARSGRAVDLRCKFIRFGASLSVFSLVRFGSAFSLSFLGFTHLGSSLSVKGFLCVGSALSLCTSLTASSFFAEFRSSG